MRECDSTAKGRYGWAGDDTYLWPGYAEAPGKIADRSERRKISAENAYKKAGMDMIDVLYNSIMVNDQNVHDPAAVRAHILNIVCPLIESGMVCRQYEKNDDCTVVIRITSKNLRRRITSNLQGIR